MKKTTKLLALLLTMVMLLGSMSTLISCKDDVVIDNENTRLVLSTSELDGVFNPFYSSSGPDGSVVGMTQIGMLSADKDGKVAYGKDEPCVVLDYEAVTDPTGAYTVYRFVLKNDLKFSNGSPLTMKDVLFNLYVYLDPAYYGSSTIYSTDIVGLMEYRTQQLNEKEQDSFNDQFSALASLRIQNLVDFLQEVTDDMYKNQSLTDEQMIAALRGLVEEFGDSYATVVDDYKLAKKYFREELERDYTYAKGTADTIEFTDKNGNRVHLTTDTEAFLYNEGLIRWDDKELEFVYSLGEKSKDWSEEQAIDALYSSYVPNKVDEVVTGWATANELHTYFSLLEKQKYFESIDDSEKITSISGIKYANMDGSVTVNGKEYTKPTLDANGAVLEGNEVLEITINKVDPKAIWNFGFTVAPMYYYSNAEQIEKFDYVSNFGVEFGSIEFQDSAIKDPDKIGVPVGAGAYKATTRDGDSSKVEAGTFRADNVVYFERNEHFMFPVTIKYVNYQVVSTNLMLDALYSGDVHMVEPACKQENIDSVAARADEGFTSTAVMTNGYGYIGINAEKIPSLAVRQAIMHAINTAYAVDYYHGYSHAITRPMTKASWAYPSEADALGQYYKFDETGATSEQLLKDAGFTKNAKGVYNKDGHTCKYVFTIAGDTTDHPAYMSLKTAAEILNEHGFDIEVKTDINALKKLNNGDLTVWAAAWGAGVDPDMYQVYHMDSTAGSTANWGYRAIKKNAGGKYDTELKLVKDLSDIIDKARETIDEKQRKAFYKDALDLVMQLAVELPTYQRSDLYAYNTNVIDETSLTPANELTPYNGPMSRLWEVSLKETGDAGAAGDNGSALPIIITVAAIVVVGGAGAGAFFVVKSKKGKKAENEANDSESSADEAISKGSFPEAPVTPAEDASAEDTSENSEG